LISSPSPPPPEPPASVVARLQRAGSYCQGFDRNVNLGFFSTADACARSLAHTVVADCNMFMWDPTHPQRGCWCCRGTNIQSHDSWNLFTTSPYFAPPSSDGRAPPALPVASPATQSCLNATGDCELINEEHGLHTRREGKPWYSYSWLVALTACATVVFAGIAGYAWIRIRGHRNGAGLRARLWRSDEAGTAIGPLSSSMLQGSVVESPLQMMELSCCHSPLSPRSASSWTQSVGESVGGFAPPVGASAGSITPLVQPCSSEKCDAESTLEPCSEHA